MTKPTPPVKEGLSEAVREQVYAVQVVPEKLAQACPEERKAIEWPSEGKVNTTGGLYAPMTEERSQEVAQWLRLCCAYTELRDGILLEKGDRLSYLFMKTKDGVLQTRMYKDPLDITTRWPSRLDVVHPEDVAESRLDAIVGDLAHSTISQVVQLKDIPKVRDVLTAFPWNPKLINLSWELRSFTVRRDCKLISIELQVQDREAPLAMTVWVGTKGSQVRLHGKGLQHMTEYDRDGRVERSRSGPLPPPTLEP